MHQGLNKANMGHYIQDKSALDPQDVEDFRVISGHYHKRQDIKCGASRKGAIGLFSYIGNPYTLGNVESSDPEKGYQILNNDGSLEHVLTNLRRHIVIELNLADPIYTQFNTNPSDIITVKAIGNRVKLQEINKEQLGIALFGHSNYKLELLPDKSDFKTIIHTSQKVESLLDSLIDELSENDKDSLKSHWRDLM